MSGNDKTPPGSPPAASSPSASSPSKSPAATSPSVTPSRDRTSAADLSLSDAVNLLGPDFDAQNQSDERSNVEGPHNIQVDVSQIIPDDDDVSNAVLEGRTLGARLAQSVAVPRIRPPAYSNTLAGRGRGESLRRSAGLGRGKDPLHLAARGRGEPPQRYDGRGRGQATSTPVTSRGPDRLVVNLSRHRNTTTSSQRNVASTDGEVMSPEQSRYAEIVDEVASASTPVSEPNSGDKTKKKKKTKTASEATTSAENQAAPKKKTQTSSTPSSKSNSGDKAKKNKKNAAEATTSTDTQAAPKKKTQASATSSSSKTATGGATPSTPASTKTARCSSFIRDVLSPGTPQSVVSEAPPEEYEIASDVELEPTAAAAEQIVNHPTWTERQKFEKYVALIGLRIDDRNVTVDLKNLDRCQNIRDVDTDHVARLYRMLMDDFSETMRGFLNTIFFGYLDSDGMYRLLDANHRLTVLRKFNKKNPDRAIGSLKLDYILNEPPADPSHLAALAAFAENKFRALKLEYTHQKILELAHRLAVNYKWNWKVNATQNDRDFAAYAARTFNQTVPSYMLRCRVISAKHMAQIVDHFNSYGTTKVPTGPTFWDPWLQKYIINPAAAMEVFLRIGTSKKNTIGKGDKETKAIKFDALKYMKKNMCYSAFETDSANLEAVCPAAVPMSELQKMFDRITMKNKKLSSAFRQVRHAAKKTGDEEVTRKKARAVLTKAISAAWEDTKKALERSGDIPKSSRRSKKSMDDPPPPSTQSGGAAVADDAEDVILYSEDPPREGFGCKLRQHCPFCHKDDYALGHPLRAYIASLARRSSEPEARRQMALLVATVYICSENTCVSCFSVMPNFRRYLQGGIFRPMPRAAPADAPVVPDAPVYLVPPPPPPLSEYVEPMNIDAEGNDAGDNAADVTAQRSQFDDDDFDIPSYEDRSEAVPQRSHLYEEDEPLQPSFEVSPFEDRSGAEESEPQSPRKKTPVKVAPVEDVYEEDTDDDDSDSAAEISEDEVHGLLKDLKSEVVDDGYESEPEPDHVVGDAEGESESEDEDTPARSNDAAGEPADNNEPEPESEDEDTPAPYHDAAGEPVHENEPEPESDDEDTEEEEPDDEHELDDEDIEEESESEREVGDLEKESYEGESDDDELEEKSEDDAAAAYRNHEEELDEESAEEEDLEEESAEEEDIEEESDEEEEREESFGKKSARKRPPQDDDAVAEEPERKKKKGV